MFMLSVVGYGYFLESPIIKLYLFKIAVFLQKMHDDQLVVGKTVEHQACYLSPRL